MHAAKLLSGFGGMLSFRLLDGDGADGAGESAAEAVIGALRLPFVAPSLGGVETLITRPATTSHAGMSPQDRERLGITSDLMRVNCGIEGQQDLIDDFSQALDT